MFLFVYGTLMNGMNHHSKIKHLQFVGKGETQDDFYMASLTCDSYPIITTEKIDSFQTPTKIKGEIYQIDEETLKKIDNFESHPNYYTRHLINVVMESTDDFELTVDAYCYIMINQNVIKDIKKFFRYTWETINYGDFREYKIRNS